MIALGMRRLESQVFVHIECHDVLQWSDGSVIGSGLCAFTETRLETDVPSLMKSDQLCIDAQRRTACRQS